MDRLLDLLALQILTLMEPGTVRATAARGLLKLLRDLQKHVSREENPPRFATGPSACWDPHAQEPLVAGHRPSR